MRLPSFLRLAFFAFMLACPPSDAQEADHRSPFERVSENEKSAFVVQDLFGRTINTEGLTLVDWEGYLANPAIKFSLTPPPDATFPATAVVSSNETRLHFDLPSATGANGPRKQIVWQKREPTPVYVSIFPDRDGVDETHQLEIEFTDAGEKREHLVLPLRVIDQDRDRADDFHVTVDFTQDQTGFFKDEAARATIVQAAHDWAYFFADMRLRPVAAGSEQTMIWGPDGFKTTSHVLNQNEYSGYLLYAYGIRNELQNADSSISAAWRLLKRNSAARSIRSGGEPSPVGGFQVAAGQAKPLRRSGGLELEVQGNYNTLGWHLTLADADWWQATNHGDVQNDLYAIAHHEIGHALIFNPNNSLVRRGAAIDDARIRSYLGILPAVSQSDHLEGTIDPESLRGAFGNEYHGKMPRGRWLITKLDLLCAQAIGYDLRETSAFTPLSFAAAELPSGSVGVPYSARLRASGGIPFYCWEVVEQLPAGLTMNSFTGAIGGVPTQPGVSDFTVRVRDYSEQSKGAMQRLRIEIGGAHAAGRSK